MTVLILVMYDKIPFGHMEDTCFFFERFKNDRRHSTTTRETTHGDDGFDDVRDARRAVKNARR